jgi:hypothetical protein
LTPKTQPANKSIASKAPITGRHHPGIPSDMISESVGDIIGIRIPAAGVDGRNQNRYLMTITPETRSRIAAHGSRRLSTRLGGARSNLAPKPQSPPRSSPSNASEHRCNPALIQPQLHACRAPSLRRPANASPDTLKSP